MSYFRRLQRPMVAFALAFAVALPFIPDAPAEIAPAAATGDVAVVQSQIVAYYTAPAAPRSDPRMVQALDAIEANSRWATRDGFLRADGSWSDINYLEVPSGVWSPWEHFRRIMTMARAYATPGQDLYRNPVLRAQLESAIAYVETFYAPSIQPSGNWWFWTIGPALDLGPALVLVAADLDPAVFERATATLAARIGPQPGVTPTFSLLEGQNLVWSAMNHTMLAVLTNDAARLDLARERLAEVAVPAGGEGIQPDFSFHQHGRQLYTGAYGAAFAYDVSKFLLFTRGTRFALSADSAAAFANYVADGVRWAIYGNAFDVSTVGREVARPSHGAFNGIAALLHMSVVPSARQDELRTAAAAMLRHWSEGFLPEHAALAIAAGSAEARWPEGFRVFADSDYVVSRRAGWYASIRMFSFRTKSGERTNDEGLLGSRQSDGRLHLVLRGDEYDGAWPALDWSRLPGITVEQRPDAASDLYGYGARYFVGGTGDGRNGIAVMDYAPLGTTLTGRKAWVFFDDAIVFMGNRIRATSAYPVETVVDQRPVAATSAIVVDGQAVTASAASRTVRWAAGDGVGYFFPTPLPVDIRQEVREGDWNTLATSNASQRVSARVRTLTIPHGVAPYDASFAYAIVPGATANAMAQWATAPPVEILVNTPAVSAARDTRNGATAYAFWGAGSTSELAVSRAAVVYIKRDRSGLRLSVADPARGSAPLRITLPGRYSLEGAQPGVTLLPGSGTVLEIAVSDGRTTEVSLRKIFSRARPVR